MVDQPLAPPFVHEPHLSGHIILCPVCGAHLGREIWYDQTKYLRIDSLVVVEVAGYCRSCGLPVKWPAK